MATEKYSLAIALGRKIQFFFFYEKVCFFLRSEIDFDKLDFPKTFEDDSLVPIEALGVMYGVAHVS